MIFTEEAEFMIQDDVYSRLRIVMKAIAWDGKVSNWRIIRCGIRTMRDLFKLRKIALLEVARHYGRTKRVG